MSSLKKIGRIGTTYNNNISEKEVKQKSHYASDLRAVSIPEHCLNFEYLFNFYALLSWGEKVKLLRDGKKSWIISIW